MSVCVFGREGERERKRERTALESHAAPLTSDLFTNVSEKYFFNIAVKKYTVVTEVPSCE